MRRRQPVSGDPSFHGDDYDDNDDGGEDHDDTADTGYNVHFVKAADQGTAANTGKFTLTIPTGTTTAFTFGQGVYDLELVSNGGVVTKLVEGKFKVKPQVSE